VAKVGYRLPCKTAGILHLHLHHSAAELPFSANLDQKRPFRSANPMELEMCRANGSEQMAGLPLISLSGRVFWKHLDSRFYPYLCESRSLGVSLEALGQQILRIFT
jgi:hypothetical protein